jgi:hypothetical protein
MNDMADWLDLYRRLWDESLDSLEAYLRALQEEAEEDEDDAC